jgi:ADP-ribosylglycohydrolase
MSLPDDYLERVYAGVLGKLIGVYLGRPIEGWTYERIQAELGELAGYVHDRLGKPLVVVDDDLSGTFIFLRALPDHGNRPDLTPAQIGETWLNYLIENRTVIWWGGRGNSTEHTAYLNLQAGKRPPQTGSARLNGRIVSEQIGAQIFIDGWALVAPGDPELAADLARRAACVSHAGEAVIAAQLLAAMEAQAFVEPDLDRLLETGLRLIPNASLVYRLVGELRELRARQDDWRAARAWIGAHYGYDRYGGNCHVIPNHALIHLALLYGEGDFSRALLIAAASGWDTDCNAGNVGCLMGIQQGLAGIAAGPDWRAPLADRMYLSSAAGGLAITDAASQAFFVANLGRALAGAPPLAPKAGARYHFELPGARMGFHGEEDRSAGASLAVENAPGRSRLGQRSLELRFTRLGTGRPLRAATPTFIPPELLSDTGGYTLQASPTLYPGQTIRAGISADPGNPAPLSTRLFHRYYSPQDELEVARSPETWLGPGEARELEWRVPATGGAPVAEVGVELAAAQPLDGAVYLDYLTWEGEPQTVLTRPPAGGAAWRRAWVDGVDHFAPWPPAPDAFRLVQNRGRGVLIQGTHQWRDYRVEATITPQLARRAGLAIRVQGMRRYYALLVDRGQTARLVKVMGVEKTLAESAFRWDFYQPLRFALRAAGSRLQAWIDGRLLCEVLDKDPSLAGGGVGLVCEEGCLACGPVEIGPLWED